MEHSLNLVNSSAKRTFEHLFLFKSNRQDQSSVHLSYQLTLYQHALLLIATSVAEGTNGPGVGKD